MSREPEVVRDELDYWKHLLEDLRELNQRTLDAASAVAPLSAEALAVLILTGDEQRYTSSNAIMTGVSTTLKALSAMQPTLDAMIDLATGRLTAITRELHGDDAELEQ